MNREKMQKRTPFLAPFDRLPLPEQISETGYKRLLELAKCAYMAINRAYPAEARKTNPKIEYRYQEAHQQVKQHLNFYKANIRDGIVPFAVITRHFESYAGDEDRSTQDFRTLIVQQFIMLHSRLVDYASLIVPDADVPSFLEVLEKVAERELSLLTTGQPGVGLSYYEAAPRYSVADLSE